MFSVIDIGVNVSADDFIQTTLNLASKTNQFGKSFILPPYLNLPKLYWKYYDELKKMFQLDPTILRKAEGKINSIITKEFKEAPSSAIIGIHVRSNREYVGHLELFGIKPIGWKYYAKAIKFFLEKYANPIFIVVSDSEVAAEKLIDQLKVTSKYVQMSIKTFIDTRSKI